MQLKLQRSQRAGGAFGGTVIFCLDARAEYSQTETDHIAKYKLGGQSVYNSQAARRHLDAMGDHLNQTQSGTTGERASGLARGLASLAMSKLHLNISVASLGEGHHIECKDLGELMEAEAALMEACRNLKQFLALAATFNGSTILVDFDHGEKVHTAQGKLELKPLPAPAFAAEVSEFTWENVTPRPVPSVSDLPPEFVADTMEAGPPRAVGLFAVASIAFLDVDILAFGGVNWITVTLAAVMLGGTIWLLRK